MCDNSNDDEFFDAIGDVKQIEEVRAKIEESRVHSPTKSNTTHTTLPSKSFHQSIPSQNLSKNNLKRPHALTLSIKQDQLNDNELTLPISDRDGRGNRDLRNTQSPKNLQQILDRLEENSAIMNEPEGARSREDATFSTESPVVRKERHAMSMYSGLRRPDISMFNPNNNSNEKNNKSTEQPSQAAGSRPSTGNAQKQSKPDPTRADTKKKSFFSSILNRKKNEGFEFTRETIKQHNKSSSNFDKVICLQYLAGDTAPVTTVGEQVNAEGSLPATPTLTKKTSKTTSYTWIAKFSPNNRFLATGNSDGILRVYKVTIMDEELEHSGSHDGDLQMIDPNYMSFVGHKLDIIDLSWYKNSSFILTSAIDKKVILWNVETQSLVKIFEHSDIVPCLSFHPLVDEFFTTGCFDKMIRIWDINETKVVDWVQTNDLITALTFSPDKSFLLVGFYKGTVKIYRTDQGKLKFTMEIHCKNTFSWGKLNKVGKKVTGIIFTEDDEFLVMTNDSRMRLVNLRTYETKIKYKGHSSGKYHIQPSYNYQKELIMSGSEDEKVYVWNKVSDYVPQINPAYSIQKANRNTSYEYFRPFGKSNTTCAVWVPFEALQKYKEKVLAVWKDIYVDDLMVLFSSDSRIKVLGNLIELEPIGEKKKSG